MRVMERNSPKVSHQRLTPSNFLNSLAPIPVMINFLFFFVVRDVREEKYTLSLGLTNEEGGKWEWEEVEEEGK